MAFLSVKTGAALALIGICVALSSPARADDRRQTVIALTQEPRLHIPAMRAGTLYGGRAILISGSGTESVSLESIPRQSVPVRRAGAGVCLDYVVDMLKLPGGGK